MSKKSGFFNTSAQRVRIAYMLPLALAACGQPRPVIIAPPAELATCADAPEAPEIPERDGTDAVQLVRDRLILTYILALRSAHGDCRAKVDGLAAWRAGVE